MDNFNTFNYELEIKEHHLDTFGHVNNATYLELMEQARWEIITAGGFGLKTIQKLECGPTVLECQIKFLKELRLRQFITIKSQVISYTKKVGLMQQDILNEDNQLCASATFTIALFDMKARKLMSPTKAWLQAIGVEA